MPGRISIKVKHPQKNKRILSEKSQPLLGGSTILGN